jgi:hypothetical protein
MLGRKWRFKVISYGLVLRQVARHRVCSPEGCHGGHTLDAIAGRIY